MVGAAVPEGVQLKGEQDSRRSVALLRQLQPRFSRVVSLLVTKFRLSAILHAACGTKNDPVITKPE